MYNVLLRRGIRAKIKCVRLWLVTYILMSSLSINFRLSCIENDWVIPQMLQRQIRTMGAYFLSVYVLYGYNVSIEQHLLLF